MSIKTKIHKVHWYKIKKKVPYFLFNLSLKLVNNQVLKNDCELQSALISNN